MTSDPAQSQMVLVTGASGGIGRATCARLARDGYDIVAQYHTRTDEAREIGTAVQGLGRQCHLIQADLTTTDGIDHVVCQTKTRRANTGGVLRGVVNSAALLLGPGFSDATPERFDTYFALNTRAPFFLAQQLSKEIARGGCIVNVSSAGTRTPSGADIVYAMSKTALEALTFHAAQILGRDGIRINTILPGFTDNGHPAFRDARVREHMERFAVLGGICDPATVADGVAFLMSETASRTTGAVLDVSGGSALNTRPSGSSFSAVLREASGLES